MKDYLMEILESYDDDDDLFMEMDDDIDDDDEECVTTDRGFMRKHANTSKSTKLRFLLALSDEEVLSSLVDPSFWKQHKPHHVDVLELLIDHAQAPRSLGFLSSQTHNFSWSATDHIRIGQAIEKQGEAKIAPLLEQVFSPSSTVSPCDFIQALITSPKYREGQVSIVAPKVVHALFDRLYHQDGVKDLFLDGIPTEFVGLHFIVGKRKQYGRDVFNLDENRFHQLIVGLSFLPKQQWSVEGSSSWFLEAFSEATRKGERVYEIYKALNKRKDINLDPIFNLLDDSDVALFGQKMLEEITPMLGKRVGAMMERGALTQATQSIHARKKM